MHKFKLIVALFWTFSIFLGSLINNSKVPKLNISNLGFDKFIHAFCYFGLVLLWLIYFNHKNSVDFKKIIYISILAFAFGIVMEFLQMFFTNDRSADVFDVLANTIGILVASLFFKLIKPKQYTTK